MPIYCHSCNQYGEPKTSTDSDTAGPLCANCDSACVEIVDAPTTGVPTTSASTSTNANAPSGSQPHIHYSSVTIGDNGDFANVTDWMQHILGGLTNQNRPDVPTAQQGQQPQTQQNNGLQQLMQQAMTALTQQMHAGRAPDRPANQQAPPMLNEYFTGNIADLLSQMLDNFEPPTQPVRANVLDNMPTVTVTQKELDRGGNWSCCAVCFDDFKIDEKLWQLPCEHLFHEVCVRQWLETQNSCPICRVPVDHGPNVNPEPVHADLGQNAEQNIEDIEELD